MFRGQRETPARQKRHRESVCAIRTGPFDQARILDPIHHLAQYPAGMAVAVHAQVRTAFTGEQVCNI